MKRFALSLIMLGALTAPAAADPAPAPAQAAPAPAAAATPGTPGAKGFDPCAVVSQTTVASAAGVTTNQVFAPTHPTKDECMWAVANKTGTGSQQIALTVQTVDQVKQAHGIARFGAILTAVQQIPGVPMPQDNPMVQHAFADAQVVTGLGDKAGWKNGTLSVLKNETLMQVSVPGANDSQGLAISKSIATSALTNINTTAQ